MFAASAQSAVHHCTSQSDWRACGLCVFASVFDRIISQFGDRTGDPFHFLKKYVDCLVVVNAQFAEPSPHKPKLQPNPNEVFQFDFCTSL